jgi:hypothetical protein
VVSGSEEEGTNRIVFPTAFSCHYDLLSSITTIPHAFDAACRNIIAPEMIAILKRCGETPLLYHSEQNVDFGQ